MFRFLKYRILYVIWHGISNLCYIALNTFWKASGDGSNETKEMPIAE